MNNVEGIGGGKGNKRLGFEIDIVNKGRVFIPEFYPEDFTQEKKRKFNRYGSGCDGESVSIKKEKNREFHVRGVVLRRSIPIVNTIIDENGPVDIISPLTSSGGVRCRVKKGQIGNVSGWDPIHEEWLFEYTLDFISTGRDEHGENDNAIVTSLLDGEAGKNNS